MCGCSVVPAVCVCVAALWCLLCVCACLLPSVVCVVDTCRCKCFAWANFMGRYRPPRVASLQMRVLDGLPGRHSRTHTTPPHSCQWEQEHAMVLCGPWPRGASACLFPPGRAPPSPFSNTGRKLHAHTHTRGIVMSWCAGNSRRSVYHEQTWTGS